MADFICAAAVGTNGFTQKLLTGVARAGVPGRGVPAQLLALVDEQPAVSQVFVVKLQTLPLKSPSAAMTCGAPDEGLQS
jgi:hypothetical protein